MKPFIGGLILAIMSNVMAWLLGVELTWSVVGLIVSIGIIGEVIDAIAGKHKC